MDAPSGTHRLTGIVSFAVLAALLYFAREICIPVALAGLLCFLLAPITARLQKWRVPRVPAALLVIGVCCAMLTALSWLMAGQMVQLADRLPQYQTIIHDKLQSLHARPGGTLDRLNRTFEDLAREVEAIPPQSDTPATATATSTAASAPTDTLPADPQPAIEVTLAKPRLTGLEVLRTALLRALHPLVTLGIVLILTLFMLIQQADLRDRAIRLMGNGQLHLTTRALDEAGSRVSRYLLFQVLVNCSFGICVWIGLLIIGVPYSPIWALLAGTLRFMPYFGVPTAALAPILMAFISHPGFVHILLVIGLFVVLETIISYLIEPWLYGAKTGISPLAILISALFWAWIWGPPGLLLSTPLTVCLAVLGKHVPGLRFLHTLLGDEPALTPPTRLYQRLLAQDHDDALELLENRFAATSLTQVYDDLMLPVIAMVEHNHMRGELNDAQAKGLLGQMANLLDDLEGWDADRQEGQRVGTVVEAQNAGRGRPILCVGTSNAADDLGARMLAGLLRTSGFTVEMASAHLLAGEFLNAVAELHPPLICLSAVTSHATMQARYLCKRLEGSSIPHQARVVGLWQTPDHAVKNHRFTPPLADYVVARMEDAVARVKSLMAAQGAVRKPALPRENPQPPALSTP